MKIKNDNDFSTIQSQVKRIETVLQDLNKRRPPGWIVMARGSEITMLVNQLRIQVDKYAKTRDSSDICEYCSKNDFDCKRSSVFNRSLDNWVCEKNKAITVEQYEKGKLE